MQRVGHDLETEQQQNGNLKQYVAVSFSAALFFKKLKNPQLEKKS